MANRHKKSSPLTTVEVVVDRWVHSGQAMAYDSSGRVVFMHGPCIPGDRVRVRLTRVKKRWARGHIEALLAPSDGRVDAPCPVLSRCGGCPWMLANPDIQRQQRLRILSDEVLKVFGDDAASVPIHDGTPAGTAPHFGYRRRARWAFERRGEGFVLGYRGRRSHAIVEATDCVVLVPALLDLYQQVSQRLQRLPATVNSGQVHALAGRDSAAATCVDPNGETLFRVGSTEVAVPTAGTLHAMSPTMFAQANETVTDAIWHWIHGHAQAVLDGQRGLHAVELFAGAGTFTSALTEAGWSVDAYDTRPRTGAMAGATFHAAELLETGAPLPQPSQTPHLILLDPPRRGAAELMDWIAASGAATVLYVACDLATALRDARALAESYELTQAWSFDMFPHSGHQEVALRLVARADAEVPT